MVYPRQDPSSKEFESPLLRQRISAAVVAASGEGGKGSGRQRMPSAVTSLDFLDSLAKVEMKEGRVGYKGWDHACRMSVLRERE